MCPNRATLTSEAGLVAGLSYYKFIYIFICIVAFSMNAAKSLCFTQADVLHSSVRTRLEEHPALPAPCLCRQSTFGNYIL
jgi:hypothetical protein